MAVCTPASDADDTILGNDGLTLALVLKETKSIADWDVLSLFLGIEDAEVQRIHQNNPGAALTQQMAILKAWLNKGQASWAVLVGALRDDLIGRAADGNRIAKAHPKGAKKAAPLQDPPIQQQDQQSPSTIPKKGLNRDMIETMKKKIENRVHEHEFATAKGIIFIVGIFGADGTAEDVKNIESTFRELNFATYVERDPPAEEIACLIQAAAECANEKMFRYSYRYIAFYFAGHGGKDESGKPFVRGLQKDDSNPENLHIDDFITTPWKDIKLTRFFFFDCCQSPGTGNAFRDTHQITKKLKPYPGEVVAFAANEGKKSSGDVTKGGIWTYYLCKNLRKAEPITTVLALTFGDVRKVQENFQEPVTHASVEALVLKEGADEQTLDSKKLMKKIPNPEDVLEALADTNVDSSDFRKKLKVSTKGELKSAIQEWIDREPVEVTWHMLIIALKETGKAGVARRIRDVYLRKPEVYEKYIDKPDYAAF